MVTNEYANRSKSAFVPFVFGQSIPLSLIICDTRHMSIYQTISKRIGLKGLFITSPRQMKQTTINTLDGYDFLVVHGLVLKDLARLLQQSVSEHPTTHE